MVRLNITMPEDIAKQLKQIKNRSHFIAEALREKFQKEKKKKLEEQLMEAYKSNREEDKSINQDWEQSTLEGWDK